MLDDLPLSVVGNLSGWSLAALLFVLMAIGRVVSVRTVEREQALLAQAAADWRAAHELSEKARQVQAAQLDEILAAVRAIAPPVRSP